MFPNPLQLGPSQCFVKYEPDVTSESLQTKRKGKQRNNQWFPILVFFGEERGGGKLLGNGIRSDGGLDFKKYCS